MKKCPKCGERAFVNENGDKFICDCGWKELKDDDIKVLCNGILIKVSMYVEAPCNNLCYYDKKICCAVCKNLKDCNSVCDDLGRFDNSPF